MSSLTLSEKQILESILGMSSGYVLDFSDRTFGEFVSEAVEKNIHDDRYSVDGTSKAKKLRAFWKLEPDHVVGKLLQELMDNLEFRGCNFEPEDRNLIIQTRKIAARLLSASPSLAPLKQHAHALNAQHLAEQIRRMESAVATDPSLAIGTAKELVETCCKTILAERGRVLPGTPDISTLTKETMKALSLVPDGIPDVAKGADVIRRLLSNLGTIGNGLAELRNLYGTGHGKHGHVTGLGPRHAKLAVGAAATLVTFLFETHSETSK